MIFRGNLFSKALEMDTGLTVVGPNGDPPEGGYRVAYLLHGQCGNSGTWADYSMLPVYAAGGNTIYIMPEAGRSFYRDMEHGQRFFTYVAEELPELCGKLFRISARREDTAVLGGSMGGYGALKCALLHPERFGMCGAFSSACLFLREGLAGQRAHGMEPAYIARFGAQTLRDFVSIFGEALECGPKDELLEAAGNLRGPKPVIYGACGESDPFREENRRFFPALEKLGFQVTYEEWKGIHDFPFFDKALKKAIDRFAL